MIFLAVTSIGYYIGSEGLISMFMENDVIVEYGSSFLRGFCIATPFLAVDFLAVGVFQACGMGKKSFIFAVMRKIVLEIPALYILNYLPCSRFTDWLTLSLSQSLYLRLQQ